MNESEIRQWLRDYGYHNLIGIKAEHVALARDEILIKMTTAAQRFLKLKPDGNPGPKTIAAMQQPRCGCHDYPRMASKQVPAFYEACRMSVGVYADWTGIRGITATAATEMMVANFEKVEKYNLRFEMVANPKDALINIRMGPAKPGVLAWMEVGDGCGWQHQSLFNVAVDWSDELLFAGTNMHEVVGHGAGLGHSPTVGGIMDPVYNPQTPNEIGDWMDREYRKRYGTSVGDVPKPEPEPEPTPEPLPPIPVPIPVPPTKPPKDPAPPNIPTPEPPGVPGMNFWQMVAIALPTIIKCIQGGATDAAISQSMRDPNTRQRRRLFRGAKQHIRQTEPRMRKRDLKVAAGVMVDNMVARAQDATPEEIRDVIADARQRAA